MWSQKAKPWIVQGERFMSQKALMLKLREIAERHNWRSGGLHPLNPKDEAFVLAFFAEHSFIEEKLGAGVKRVLIGSSHALDGQGYNNWCYYFDTFDRERPIDIGAVACFKSFDKIEDFTAACYTAVETRATAICDRDFGANNEIVCPETGEIVNKQYCFVAYCSPSMRAIVKQFIETYNIDINMVEIDGKTQRIFRNIELRRCFFDFHGNLARMRVIGPTAFFKRMQRNCSVVPLAKDIVGF